jgi:hypothetical protein
MPETPVLIPVEKGLVTLEGLFEPGTIARNAVICHPHPLYGGDMENNVVWAVRQTFADSGWGTLRFNFRGTGASGGNQAEGKKDAYDLMEVSGFINARAAGLIDFAAYSYGARVSMEAIQLGLRTDSLVLVSPPLDFASFEELKLPDAPVLIIVGDRDEFCSISSLEKWLNTQSTALLTLEVLAGVDHFYSGAALQLSAKITSFLKDRVLNPPNVSDKNCESPG